MVEPLLNSTMALLVYIPIILSFPNHAQQILPVVGTLVGGFNHLEKYQSMGRIIYYGK